LQPRFHRQKGVAKSLRRIAVAEIDTALAAIADEKADEADKIHDVRQQLKRLRALIRLPRKHLDGYREENAAFRDLARRLARTRDADVLTETFDDVTGEAGVTAPRLRAELMASVEKPGVASRQSLLEGEIADGLRKARGRAAQWRFDRGGFPLIGKGLERIYRDMRDTEAHAAAQPTPENFHEWRKQTKYHANQLALLRAVAPKIFNSYCKIADELGTTLGDHHDLDALSAALHRLGDTGTNKRSRLVKAVRARNRKLERRAFRLGDELTAERPADFFRRIEAGWHAWRA